MSKDKENKKDKNEDLFSEEENISNISFKDLISGKVKLNNPEEDRMTKEEIRELLKKLWEPVDIVPSIWRDCTKGLNKQLYEAVKVDGNINRMMRELDEAVKLNNVRGLKGIDDIITAFDIQAELFEGFMIPSLTEAMDKYMETLRRINDNLTREIESYGVEYLPYELENDIKLLEAILNSSNTKDDLSVPLLGYIFTAFNTHIKKYQGEAKIEGEEYVIQHEDIPEEETELLKFAKLFDELLEVSDIEEVKTKEEEVSREMRTFYRQSLELINQERQSEETKLKLFDEAKIDKSSLDDIGLNLSDGEIQALHAVTKLLDKTRHKGHEVDMIRDPITGKYTPSPVIYTSLSEYYEAYELPKDKNGYYQKKQRDAADKNLEALTKTHTIVGKKKISEREVKTKRGKKRTEDVIRTVQTDVTLIKRTFIKDFSPEELGKYGYTPEELMSKLSTVRTDTDLTGNKTLLILRYDPFFIERIETFFALLPTDLYQRAKMISNGKYVNQTVELLKLIHMHRGKLNKDGYLEIKRHYKNLSLTLGLNADIESRHYSRAIKKIEYCMDRLTEHGYLLPESNYNAGSDMVTLIMNPDKLPRAGSFYKKQLQKPKNKGDDKE